MWYIHAMRMNNLQVQLQQMNLMDIIFSERSQMIEYILSNSIYIMYKNGLEGVDKGEVIFYTPKACLSKEFKGISHGLVWGMHKKQTVSGLVALRIV